MSVNNKNPAPYLSDPWLLAVTLLLLSLGLVMLTSASLTLAEQRYGDPFYFVTRQVVFVFIALIISSFVLVVRLEYWEKLANPLLVLSICFLIAVLVPSLGKEVNGSSRWISLGFINMQVSELAKVALVVYFAAYLVRKKEEVQQSLAAFVKAMVPLAVVSVLLLREPDLGAAAVMLGTTLGMFFLAGVRLSHFALLGITATAGIVGLILISPYRAERLVSYLRACEPEFFHDQGYQLCQALIAFSRGEWFGVGLGNSVQKLFYLPEVHTDFLLAALGEELGVIGSLVIIASFALLVFRAFCIGRQAERGNVSFGSHLAYGIGLWLGIQALVNIGVNMGLLPTKGLTLPLMSYGGSSIVVTCVAIALLFRVAHETRSGGEKRAVGRGIWVRAS